MKHISIVFLIALGFLGCTKQTETPSNKLVTIKFLNKSDFHISNISIYSNKTNRFLDYNFLPKDGEFSYSFKRQDKSSNVLSLSWQVNQYRYKHENIVIEKSKLSNVDGLTFELLNYGRYIMYIPIESK